MRDKKSCLSKAVTLKKMREYGRLPIIELLMRNDDENDSDDYDRIYCDSLMISAYNSEAGEEWAFDKLDVNVPNASICSKEEFDLYSESSQIDLSES